MTDRESDRPSAPQAYQYLLSHLLATLGAQEKADCTLMLSSTDSCQNRVSADHSHDRIVGSGVDLLRSSISWSYPLIIYSFSNDRRLTFTFFKNSYQICCVYVSIAPHYDDFDFDAKIQPVFLKYRWGRPFLTMVTFWSRSTSNFYALIG